MGEKTNMLSDERDSFLFATLIRRRKGKRMTNLLKNLFHKVEKYFETKCKYLEVKYKCFCN